MDFSLIFLFIKFTLNRTAEKEVFQSHICSTELNVKTFGYCKILIRLWCVFVCCFGIRGSINFCWKKVQNWNQRFFSKQKTIGFFQFNKVQVRCKVFHEHIQVVYNTEWFVNKWKTSMDNAKSELTTTSGAKADGFKMGKCLGFCILKWHNIKSSTNWLCALTYDCCNQF